MSEVPTGPSQAGPAVLRQTAATPFTYVPIRETIQSAAGGQNFRDLYRENNGRISLTDLSRSTVREVSAEAGRLLQQGPAIEDIKAIRAELRGQKKVTISELRAALKAEYRGSKRKIRQNPDFKQELAGRVQSNEDLVRIALQRTMLNSLERSLRNSAKKSEIDDQMATITDEQAEERRKQLVASARARLEAEVSEAGKRTLTFKIKRIEHMPLSMIKRALAENDLKMLNSATQTGEQNQTAITEKPATEGGTQTEEINQTAIPEQSTAEGATQTGEQNHAEAEMQTVRAGELNARLQSESALKRVRRALGNAGRNTAEFFKGLTRPAVLASALSLTALFGAPALEHLMPTQSVPSLTAAGAEAPDHSKISQTVAAPSSGDKAKPQPIEAQPDKKESKEVIDKRRAESLSAIGGPERLAKLQEQAEAFKTPLNEYLNLEVNVNGQEFRVEAGFVEYSESYKDDKGNLPFGGGRATAAQLQEAINRSLQEDPEGAKNIKDRDGASRWVKELKRLGTDCAGLVARIYEKAYEGLDLGNFYQKIGIESGNLNATGFLNLAKEGKEGFHILEDRAINILNPGTIILFIDDNNPNEAVHATVVVDVQIGEDGGLYAVVAENTDVTEGRAKGAHSFKILVKNPYGPISAQFTEGVFYDFGQLVQDNPKLAEELAGQREVNIDGLTPEQVRKHPKLQKISYENRFWETGYVAIANDKLEK